MKKIFKILFFLILSNCIIGQNDFQLLYADFPDGEYTKYYNNGKTKSSFYIENGKIEGIFCTYYRNGNLSNCIEFVNGKIHGKETIFYRDGRKSSEIKYHQDSLLSQKEYYYKKDILVKIGNWTIDSAVTYKKVSQLTFKNFLQTEQKDISINGYYVEYYPNGSKKLEGVYRNRKKYGAWTYYDIKGSIEQQLLFSNDKMIESIPVHQL